MKIWAVLLMNSSLLLAELIVLMVLMLLIELLSSMTGVESGSVEAMALASRSVASLVGAELVVPSVGTVLETVPTGCPS